MYDQNVKADPKALMEYAGFCDKPINYQTPIAGPAESKGVMVNGSAGNTDMYAKPTGVKINTGLNKKLISRSY